MNPHLNPKLANVPPDQLRGKMGLIFGFNGPVLYRKASRDRGDTISLSTEHGVNPVMFKCWRCGKEQPDIGLPGKCVSYNYESQALDLDPELPRLVETIMACPECQASYQERAAKLYCNKCQKVIALIQAGKMPSGEEIQERRVFHTETCPTCNPGQKMIQILEFSNANPVRPDQRPPE